MKSGLHNRYQRAILLVLLERKALTVVDGREAGVDVVLVQTFLFYFVNQVILMLTCIFQGQFP